MFPFSESTTTQELSLKASNFKGLFMWGYLVTKMEKSETLDNTKKPNSLEKDFVEKNSLFGVVDTYTFAVFGPLKAQNRQKLGVFTHD